MKSTHLVAAALAASLLLGASAAHAVPSTVSFTARITTDEGTPVEGNVALVLRVYDAAEDGTLLWEETQPSVPAEEGLVYASLGSVDPVNNGLDGSVFTGSAAFLELTVDGDVLSPRIPIESVPYAINAGRADVATTLEGFDPTTVQTRVTGTCAAGMYVMSVNADGTVACGTDANSGGDILGITPGPGLIGGGGSGNVTLSVDTATIQSRVTGACAAGMFVTGVNQNGTVVCAADANAGGDITGVAAGAGLTGGGTTGGVTLTVDTAAIQARVTGTCAAGMFVTGVNQNGTVVCAADANAGGDITGVTAGTGLTGGGATGGVTLTVDTAVVQSRVTGTCAAGMYVTGVNQNGTVVCGTDANAGGDITGVAAGTGLTGGGTTGALTLSVNPAAVQTRVAGTCAAGMFVTGVNENGTVVCAADANAGGDITGVTAGTGLSGGGTTGSPTLSVNPAAVQTRVSGTCAAGMYVTGVNENGTVVCGTDATGGTGDITGVTAGTGLAGGGTTGALTLGIANNGVNTAQIASGAVTMSKTSAPIGAMASDATFISTAATLYNAGATVAMDDVGTCHVTSFTHANFFYTFNMQPALLSLATNTTSTTGALASSYSVNGGGGAEVSSTAIFQIPAAGNYRFGCQITGNGLLNTSFVCRTTWVCN